VLSCFHPVARDRNKKGNGGRAEKLIEAAFLLQKGDSFIFSDRIRPGIEQSHIRYAWNDRLAPCRARKGRIQMGDEADRPDKFSGLRKRAEKALKGKVGEDWDPSKLSIDDARRLIEELHIHQIELEMQNEELRRAQLELAESRDTFLDLYDFAPVGYLTLSDKGMIQAVNLTTATLLTVERKNLLNAPLSRFVFEDDQNTYWHCLRDIFKGQPRQICELRMLKRDGGQFNARLEAVAAQDADGRFSQCRMAIFDITESERTKESLRISHRFLKLANESSNMDMLLKGFVEEVRNFTGCDAAGIRILDKEGNIPYEAYLGFDESFHDSESPLSIHSDLCLSTSVIKGEVDRSQSFITERGSFCVNGASRFLATLSRKEKRNVRDAWSKYGYESVALIPIKTRENILGLIHIADHREDMAPLDTVETLESVALQLGTAIGRVKARHELEESESRYRRLSESLEKEVEEKAAQLTEAESLAAVGRMVSTVAHEVRNPLQNIRMGVDAMRKKAGNDKDKLEILEEIDFGVNMLNQTIRELLEYSKPLEMKYASVPIRGIIDRSLKTLVDRLKDIDVHLELDPKTPEISVDRVKFTAAFTNLILNAVEAMPEGGDIWISSKLSEMPGANVLLISISDAGCGIDQAHMENIYEPFFTTKTRGTGLGLPTCKKIIEAHGGTLSISSELNKGTTAEITLPI
jgi:PAS domain S-box-containing protein